MTNSCGVLARCSVTSTKGLRVFTTCCRACANRCGFSTCRIRNCTDTNCHMSLSLCIRTHCNSVSILAISHCFRIGTNSNIICIISFCHITYSNSISTSRLIKRTNCSSRRTSSLVTTTNCGSRVLCSSIAKAISHMTLTFDTSLSIVIIPHNYRVCTYLIRTITSRKIIWGNINCTIP